MRNGGERSGPYRARRAALVALALLAIGSAPAAAWAQEAAPPPTHGKLTVSLVNYMECANEYAFVRGEGVMLTGGGLLPNETVTVVMERDGGDLPVGTVRGNARGFLSASVTIPSAAPTDSDVRLRATAEKGEDGRGLILRSPPLRIFADHRDSDADGVEDRCDTCPNLASKDLTDSDGDGLGDVCDKCPNDSDNDSDGDGLCADVDPNPYAPEPSAGKP